MLICSDILSIGAAGYSSCISVLQPNQTLLLFNTMCVVKHHFNSIQDSTFKILQHFIADQTKRTNAKMSQYGFSLSIYHALWPIR